MKIARRLEDGARVLARVARGHRAALPAGPEAVFARVLDGEHLWFAVAAAEGRPALLDPETLEPVAAEGACLADDADPAYHSTRWRLEDCLPEAEDAELLLTVLHDGRAAGVRPGPPPPESHLRVPPTPDGQWRFLVAPDADGFLRVRRTRTARVARLLDVRVDGDAVELTIAPPDDGVGPDLLLLRRDASVGALLPTEAVDVGLRARLRAADLPREGRGYRVAVGSPADPVTVVRLHNDLHISEGSNVLLPHVLDADGDVVGRLAFTSAGVLRLTTRKAGGGAA